MKSPPKISPGFRDTVPSSDFEHGFSFVHVDQQSTVKPASCTATARSYVMKRFHRRKQLDDRQRLENFRNVTGAEVQKKPKKPANTRKMSSITSPTSTTVSPSTLDPFLCFAADTSELPTLLGHREPILLLDSSTPPIMDQARLQDIQLDARSLNHRNNHAD